MTKPTHRTEDAPTVMAISSGGGHWVELLRLRPAWTGCNVVYVSTDPAYAKEVGAGAHQRAPRFHAVPDANRWQKLRLLRQLVSIAALIFWYRPDVIVSTGAAPGYFAVRLGALIGIKTIWIDSIANGEELSMSGRLAGRYAKIFLTQWPHLSKVGGRQGAAPFYWGAVV